MNENNRGPGVSKEVLSSIVENKEEKPSSSEVLDAFEQKRISLESQMNNLKSVNGANLDILEAQKRRKNISDTQEELVQVNTLWTQLGGGDIDEAIKSKSELGFKATADDHVEANAGVRDAKDRFYDNFLKEYGRSETDEGEHNDVSEKSENGDTKSPSKIDVKSPAGGSVGLELDVWGEHQSPGTEAIEETQPDDSGVEGDNTAKKTNEEEAADTLRGRIPGFDKLSPAEKNLYINIFLVFNNSGLIKAETTEPQGGGDKTPDLESANKTILEGLGAEKETVSRNLERYAKLKADQETKGRIGRKKRLEQLQDAEMNLIASQLDWGTALVEKRREVGGFYEDEKRTVKEQMADDLMNEMRNLDRLARTATNEELKGRIENRKWYQKAAVSIGKFLNGGDRWYSRLARNAGPGFLAGFGVAVTGVGWPVTTAVGVGLGAAVYGISRTTLADESLKVHESGVVLTDKRAQEILSKIQSNTEDIIDQAKGFGEAILGESRTSGENVNKLNAKKARKNMGMFGIGYAAGGILGTLSHNFLNQTPDSPGPGEPKPGPENPKPGPGDPKPGPEIPTPPERGVPINTNRAPEHAFEALTEKFSDLLKGQNSEALFNEIYNQTGGNVFIDQNGSNIPMKDFGGKIGRGWTEWDLDKIARLSAPARAALRAKGYLV